MRDSSIRYIRSLKSVNLPDGDLKDFIDDVVDMSEELANTKTGLCKIMTEMEYLKAENEGLKKKLGGAAYEG